MRLFNHKIALGLIAGAFIAGPAVADGGSRYSTNPFESPTVYVTPPATALSFTLPSPNGIPYRWIVNLGAREQVRQRAAGRLRRGRSGRIGDRLTHGLVEAQIQLKAGLVAAQCG
ncbi:MAG: hypothetical protein N2444_01750, partial [Methylocystis sp.]|nr:hypothetical protein [Methylocystis sp.]